MADSKPLASLSAGLLARKGAARPAMRRQTQLPGIGNGHFNGHEDLGWNDMGYDVDPHHVGQDGERAVNHGLSPMAATLEADSEADAMDAFTAAVDRAMAAPAQKPASTPTPVGPASIAPIVADAPLPVPGEPPLVVRQQEAIEAAVGTRLSADMAEAPVALLSVRTPRVIPSPAPFAAQPSAPARASAGLRGTYAFTLRLDPDRHLRLRLASATSNRSAQQILIALVDDFLSTVPEIDAFAARLPASAAR